MKTRKPTALVSAIALLGGCTTTLEVRHDSGRDLSAGIPAVLPFTRYEITATWRLARCEEGDPKTPSPKVALTIEATAGAEDDPNRTYLIDSNSLQAPLNTSQLSVTYHENSSTLKTINAEVEDRTPQVIGNVVRTVAAIAPLMLMDGSTSPSTSARTIVPCDRSAIDALALVERLEGTLDTMNDEVAVATEQAATAAAAAAHMGSAIDPETSARYGAALRELDRLTTAQASLASQLSNALKPLTYRQVIRWPNDSAELVSPNGWQIPQNVLNRWFGTNSGAPRTSPAEWPQAFFAIERMVPARPNEADEQRTGAGSSTARPARVAGIPYRALVRGRLVTCDNRCDSVQGNERRAVIEGPVAQLGAVHVLPVRNPPFGSIAFAAEFRRDGTLVSAGYTQRAAPLERASGAVADAAEALAPLFDPTARLTRDTARLHALQQNQEALAALQPAAADPNADALGELAAETTLLNAQISNLQARLAKQELEARLAPH